MSRMRILKVCLAALAVLAATWLYFAPVPGLDAITGRASSLSSNEMSAVDVQTGLPAPGSYTLHRIFAAPDRPLLNSRGESRALTQYTSGKYTLLTFFYQHCTDADGCPYVMTVFNMVRNALQRDADLARSVRLVSISFDPERDTPMMMAGLEKQMNGVGRPGQIPWHFLTTASIDALMPLIDGFGQSVDIILNPQTGSETLAYQHILKVFLIDKAGFVREIYSTAYLSPQMLLNDIKTLALEEDA